MLTTGDLAASARRPRDEDERAIRHRGFGIVSAVIRLAFHVVKAVLLGLATQR